MGDIVTALQHEEDASQVSFEGSKERRKKEEQAGGERARG